MKAIVKYDEKAGSVEVRDMLEPVPGPTEVKVKIKAAGLCYSDVSIMQNKYVGRKPVPIPLIMGHEGAGVIAELGPEASGHAVGDRVALEPLSGCGRCDQCRNGFSNMCLDWEHLGITCHGTFAEYVTLSENKAHKISGDMDFAEAAILEPLGLVVRSLEQSKPMVGDSVAILGPGALGMMHLLAYKAAGAAKVIMIGLEQDRARFDIARSLGADHIINLSEQDPVEAILEYTRGRGADIVVETANSPKAAQLTFELAAPRGRVVLFGLYSESSFSPLQLLRKGLTVYGDVAVVPRQFSRAINWIESGRVDLQAIITKRFGMNEVQAAFEAARKGEAIKVVFEF